MITSEPTTMKQPLNWLTRNNDVGRTERKLVVFDGNLLLRRPVQDFGLKEDARVLVLDASEQQTFTFDCTSWNDNLKF